MFKRNTVKKTYQYILFDLDGTLTDPKEGITKSVQYALKDFGVEEPDLDKLEKFIGPPLRLSFPEFYGFSEEQTTKAIQKFRERYNVTGVFENEIYAGMAAFLQECKAEGIRLAIASSKPQYLVEKVLERFEIGQYFDVIVGCIDEGKRDTKIEVMEEALRQLFAKTVSKKKEADERDMTVVEFPREQVLMVGDRVFDIEGAKHFGVDSLGVTYGYAKKGELEGAGATYLAGSIAEMRHVILGRWQNRKDMGRPSFSKSLEVLTPLALYWFITMLVTLVSATVIRAVTPENPAAERAVWLQNHSNQISVWVSALAVVMTYPMTVYYWKRSLVPEISPVVKRRNAKRLLVFGAGIFVWAGIVAVGLNIAMNYLSIFQSSESYTQVSNIQYSVSAPVGVIIFGILTPIGEELLFRGILFNRLKRYFSPIIAVLASAFIFGIYHGNLVQFIYATIMGICMALLYEKFERLLAPVLFHCGANSMIYIITKKETLANLLANIPVMTVCLLIGGAGILGLIAGLYKRKSFKLEK